MLRLGFSYRSVVDERKFETFAFVYHIALVATQCFMLFLRGGYEILDFNTIEISKVSFRWVMGILASMMVSPYLAALVVRGYYKAIGLPFRDYEEMAMVIGFLSMMFFSVNLFGFWGLLWLPASPPIVVSVLQIAVMRLRQRGRGDSI